MLIANPNIIRGKKNRRNLTIVEEDDVPLTDTGTDTGKGADLGIGLFDGSTSAT